MKDCPFLKSYQFGDTTFYSCTDKERIAREIKKIKGGDRANEFVLHSCCMVFMCDMHPEISLKELECELSTRSKQHARRRNHTAKTRCLV
jgi:hypothetical protein